MNHWSSLAYKTTIQMVCEATTCAYTPSGHFLPVLSEHPPACTIRQGTHTITDNRYRVWCAWLEWRMLLSDRGARSPGSWWGQISAGAHHVFLGGCFQSFLSVNTFLRQQICNRGSCGILLGNLLELSINNRFCHFFVVFDLSVQGKYFVQMRPTFFLQKINKLLGAGSMGGLTRSCRALPTSVIILHTAVVSLCRSLKSLPIQGRYCFPLEITTVSACGTHFH